MIDKMRFIVVCQNDFLPKLLKGFARDCEVVALVGDKSLQGRLSRLKIKSLRGDLVEEAVYKRVLLKPDDRVLIHLDDPHLLKSASQNLRAIYGDLPLLAICDEASAHDVKAVPDLRFIPIARMLCDLTDAEFKQAANFQKATKLRAVLGAAERILILTQDNPDPDAIASGLALRALLGRNKTTAPVASFTEVTRPENLAMLRLLEIEVEKITQRDLANFELIATVDVQPSYFHWHSKKFAAVTDHHPEGKAYRVEFKDVRPGYGSTSTILTEYLQAADVKLTQKLATALLYGIKSDTLFLGREVSKSDIDAFFYLYPHANHSILRRIEGPEFPLEDLDYLKRAIEDKRVVDKVYFSHLGKVPRDDLIPHIADFCLNVAGVEWSVISGVCDGRVVVSVRNVGYVKNAGELLKACFGAIGDAGGHRSLAKAVIPLKWFRADGVLKAGQTIGDKIIDMVMEKV